MLENEKKLTAWDKVLIARDKDRLRGKELVDNLVTDFFEIHGDQYFADDHSIMAGIGFLFDMPVTVIAQIKGKTLEENLERNFGMSNPDGFRKSLRVAKEAEKFHRPIICIVDTPGAYPGKDAEERGQARAIANNLLVFSKLKTPLISIVLSEGGSGGALALTISDYLFMFENAIYSILSPEGFNSILFKNQKPIEEVAEVMKMTSADLLSLGIIDEVISEPNGAINSINDFDFQQFKERLYQKIIELKNKNIKDLLENRYIKYRNIK